MLANPYAVLICPNKHATFIPFHELPHDSRIPIEKKEHTTVDPKHSPGGITGYNTRMTDAQTLVNTAEGGGECQQQPAGHVQEDAEFGHPANMRVPRPETEFVTKGLSNFMKMAGEMHRSYRGLANHSVRCPTLRCALQPVTLGG